MSSSYINILAPRLGLRFMIRLKECQCLSWWERVKDTQFLHQPSPPCYSLAQNICQWSDRNKQSWVWANNFREAKGNDNMKRDSKVFILSKSPISPHSMPSFKIGSEKQAAVLFFCLFSLLMIFGVSFRKNPPKILQNNPPTAVKIDFRKPVRD